MANEMVEALGIRVKRDSVGDVISLDTAANRFWVDDAQMQEILIYPKLASLTLEGPSITDALVPRIAQLQGLTSLALRNTLIGDRGILQLAGLKVLADYKELKQLTLRDVPVKGAALSVLPHPEKLLSLNMAQSRITDVEVAHLAGMTRLRKLLPGCAIRSNLPGYIVIKAIINTLLPVSKPTTMSISIPRSMSHLL